MTPGVCTGDETPPMLDSGVVLSTGWEACGFVEGRASGPVGLVVCSLSQLGARIDANWNMYASFMVK
eukprot:4184680-Alexandrium_andersonii.AAC.1